jgi:hypothetical protein
MSRYSRFGAFPGWILTAALLGGVAYAYFSNWLCPINRVLCIKRGRGAGEYGPGISPTTKQDYVDAAGNIRTAFPELGL